MFKNNIFTLLSYVSVAIIAMLFVAPNQAFAAPNCTLTAGDDEYIVNFSGAIIFSSAQPHTTTANNLSIPAGEYELTSQTWDDHAAHGGQGQVYERVQYAIRSASERMVLTGATPDIAENQNWRTYTFPNTFTLDDTTTSVVARHAHIGTGNYQSVTPICVKFSRVDDPTPPEVSLEVSCSASPRTADEDETVVWDADAAGGTGTYTYEWSGQNINGRDDETISTSYATDGTKTASVTVTSGSQTATANCSVTIENDHHYNDDLDVICRVSDTRIEEGDVVTYTADIEGGDRPYDIEWRGDVDGDDETERVRYNREGTYEAEVIVTDDEGRTARDTCDDVRVREEEDDDDDLEIICRVSDTRIEEGDIVTYEVEIDGGNSPFDIDWSGDIDGDDERERIRYNREGTYEVRVTVEDDDGNRDSDTCDDVRVRDEDDDDRDITVTTSGGLGTPSGNLASLDSVFLSQVPYTGPADVLKALGILALIAIWSTGVAFWFKKRRQTAVASRRVEAFKKANQAARRV